MYFKLKVFQNSFVQQEVSTFRKDKRLITLFTLHIPLTTFSAEYYSNSNYKGEKDKGETTSGELNSRPNRTSQLYAWNSRYFMLLYYLNIFILFRNRAPLLERTRTLRYLLCILKIVARLWSKISLAPATLTLPSLLSLFPRIVQEEFLLLALSATAEWSMLYLAQQLECVWYSCQSRILQPVRKMGEKILRTPPVNQA